MKLSHTYLRLTAPAPSQKHQRRARYRLAPEPSTSLDPDEAGRGEARPLRVYAAPSGMLPSPSPPLIYGFTTAPQPGAERLTPEVPGYPASVQHGQGSWSSDLTWRACAERRAIEACSPTSAGNTTEKVQWVALLQWRAEPPLPQGAIKDRRLPGIPVMRWAAAQGRKTDKRLTDAREKDRSFSLSHPNSQLCSLRVHLLSGANVPASQHGLKPAPREPGSLAPDSGAPKALVHQRKLQCITASHPCPGQMIETIVMAPRS